MIRSRTWLIGIVGLAAVGGLFAGALGDGSVATELALGGVVVPPLYVLTYLWIKADARERATSSPPGAIPLIVGLFPVAVPYYLIATRRGWGKGVALLCFIGFFLALLVVNALAAFAGWWLAN